MLAYDISCKYPYNYDDNSLIRAFDVIQLTETHEVGEILNGYWLIINCDIPWKERPTYNFNAGQYVKVIDIRYFSCFATDKNFDDRSDLVKYGTESRLYSNQNVIVNKYGFK